MGGGGHREVRTMRRRLWERIDEEVVEVIVVGVSGSVVLRGKVMVSVER